MYNLRSVFLRLSLICADQNVNTVIKKILKILAMYIARLYNADKKDANRQISLNLKGGSTEPPFYLCLKSYFLKAGT